MYEHEEKNPLVFDDFYLNGIVFIGTFSNLSFVWLFLKDVNNKFFHVSTWQQGIMNVHNRFLFLLLKINLKYLVFKLSCCSFRKKQRKRIDGQDLFSVSVATKS